jgi:hypothetical protein
MRSEAEIRFEKRMQEKDPNYKLPEPERPIGMGPPLGYRSANDQHTYEAAIRNAPARVAAKKAQGEA